MKNSLVLTAFLPTLFALGVNAGSATIVGTAHLSERPDYVEFTISINSVCFPSRTDLKAHHDPIVSDLQKTLQSLIGTESETNGVSTDGGRSGKYHHTIYRMSGQSENVCVGTYQKTTNIAVKSDKFAEFSNIFDAITDAVDLAVSGQEGGEDEPSISASVGHPYSKICAARRHELELSALTAAREDAERKFSAIFSGTNICRSDVEIVDASLPSHEGGSMRGYGKSLVVESAAPSISPILVTIENIDIIVSYQFAFKYGTCTPFQTTTTTSREILNF